MGTSTATERRTTAGRRQCVCCRRRKRPDAFFNGNRVCRVCAAAGYHRRPSSPHREPAVLPVIRALAPYDDGLRQAVGRRWWTRLSRDLRREGVLT